MPIFLRYLMMGSSLVCVVVMSILIMTGKPNYEAYLAGAMAVVLAYMSTEFRKYK